MLYFVLLASGFAAYGAPTNHDAYQAFIDRILVDARESGDVLREESGWAQSNVPLDVIIERCVRKQNRKVPLRNGGVEFYAGYDCILEVWPKTEAPYRTWGFFRHDGFSWHFHGPARAAYLPSPDEFDPFGRSGETITKSGSLDYDGDPKNPLNENYDPYRDFFDQTKWNENYTNY